MLIKGRFPRSRIFYVRTDIDFTCMNKIENFKVMAYSSQSFYRIEHFTSIFLFLFLGCIKHSNMSKICFKSSFRR